MFSVRRYLGDEDADGDDREAKLRRLKEKLSKKKKPVTSTSDQVSSHDAHSQPDKRASGEVEPTRDEKPTQADEKDSRKKPKRKGLQHEDADKEVVHDEGEQNDADKAATHKRKGKRRRTESEQGEENAQRGSNVATPKVSNMLMS